MTTRLPDAVFAAALAIFVPVCTTPVRPTTTPALPVTSLWQPPDDLASRDLFVGAWSPDHAPVADDTYVLVGVKRSGVNPGITVRDSRGRKWSVKQRDPDMLDDEGPVEVTVSRILQAVGYHQPAVYYLPAFSLTDDWGTRVVPGGRFRLSDPSLKETGSWSWQQNPFVGTRPYQGLLAILLMLNGSDFKNANNSLYVRRIGDRAEWWYVVRDLGSALGQTGRLAPRKNDIESFERSRFITGITGGFVTFAYHGWHQELVRGRLTPADVGWAANRLSGLSDLQWHQAFRAGGYSSSLADRFIRKIHVNIAQAVRIADAPQLSAERR